MAYSRSSTTDLLDSPELGCHNKIVLRKLVDVCRYMASAERLRWYKLYLAHGIYSYTSELSAAFVGLGISFPLARIIAGSDNANLSDALRNTPNWLTVLTVAVAAIWVVLKVSLSFGDASKRAPLARSCRREIAALNIELHSELDDPYPMPGLNKIYKAMQEIIQRHHAEDSWPPEWQASPAPDALIYKDVKQRVRVFCEIYGSIWDAFPAFDRFERAQAVHNDAPDSTGPTDR